MARPNLIVLAGPNGAGKTTAAQTLLMSTLDLTEFVNADMLAQGLSGFHPESARMPSGRVMLERLRKLGKRRADFAFETTLASKTFATWLRTLVESGYAFHLIFFWLPSADFSVSRVAERVRTGGHNVPEEDIRRRYPRGLANFLTIYQPLATTWRMYDNSNRSGPVLIAEGAADGLNVADETLWKRISIAK